MCKEHLTKAPSTRSVISLVCFALRSVFLLLCEHENPHLILLKNIVLQPSAFLWVSGRKCCPEKARGLHRWQPESRSDADMSRRPSGCRGAPGGMQRAEPHPGCCGESRTFHGQPWRREHRGCSAGAEPLRYWTAGTRWQQ